MTYSEHIRPILEALYFLAGIGLVAGLFIGIQQLKVLKKDIEVKYKRDSLDKSIEYLHLFATHLIPLGDEVMGKVNNEDLTAYTGPYDSRFIFDKNCNLNQKSTVEWINKCLEHGGLNFINQLEFFSAAMVSGIADEELAFNPLASSYCGSVEFFYELICKYRDDESSKQYGYVVELYNIWKERLISMEHEKAKNKSNINVRRIKSIGS